MDDLVMAALSGPGSNGRVAQKFFDGNQEE